MIAHFSQQLRDDLEQLMVLNMAPVASLTYKDRQLRRISSTESQPMSLISDAGGEGVTVAPVSFTAFWANVRHSLTRFRPGN
jgi:hypothetical protein